MTFEGKVALVTGASRGIGAATALHLGDLGARVMLVARSGRDIADLADDIRDHGHEAEALTCDVADAASVANVAAATRDRFGRLDLVVNNAGLIDPIARIDDSDPAAWARVMNVNVLGVYHVLQATLPMLAASQGTVVNVSSIAAVRALEGWSHYCASKAAVLSLTRSVHVEHPDVTAVGLSPGTVATGMQTAIAASGINPVSQAPWDAHIPPEWVAKAIAWLWDGGAEPYRGFDFSIKHRYGRRAVGLPEDGALDGTWEETRHG
ncbi:SDR family oxidoreductase [Jannaschia sp. LMIT008]|uniref:SDR family oxidoreductase n=1 Tax=Jannaschia maritima TaxID=3032585 RepID=UPI002810CB32|nr:SDR family oxidoreductase [Jannaschia sp. LMIT008]